MFNESAFPRPASEYTEKGTLADGNDAEAAQVGMTLRDYFAAKAMAAIMTNPNLLTAAVETGVESGFSSWNAVSNAVSIWAYKYADAMLAARAKI